MPHLYAASVQHYCTVPVGSEARQLPEREYSKTDSPPMGALCDYISWVQARTAFDDMYSLLLHTT
eukprot:4872-Heterococcus_DN1.PRE.2